MTIRSLVSMLLPLAATLSGCSANVVGKSSAAGAYTVGGTISALQGSGLVLGNSDGSTLTVGAGSKSFTFNAAFATGKPYNISVMTQPGNPSQTCSVAQGTGTVGAGNVTNVAVTCSSTSNTYRISGSVSGLSGTGLILGSSSGGAVAVTRNGSFKLPQSIPSGGTYFVGVLATPNSPLQGCTVANASGTVGTANVTNVTVTCNNANEEVIISNQQGMTAAYAIDPATGALASIGTATGLTSSGPLGSTDPTGKFLFVPNAAAPPSIAAYTINHSTGATVAVTGSPFGASASPDGPVIDPTGKFLYLGSAAGALAYAIDPATGALSLVTGSPFAGLSGGGNPGGVACPCVVTSGFLYYTHSMASGNFATGDFSINPTSGALGTASAAGPTACCTDDVHAISELSGNFFFLLADASLQSFVINPGTGALGTPTVTTAPAGSTWTGVVVDPSGQFAYVLNSADPSFIYAFSINPVSGVLTALASPTVATGGHAQQIRFDHTGNHVYVASSAPASIWTYSFDPATGALVAVGGGEILTAVVPNGLVVVSLL